MSKFKNNSTRLRDFFIRFLFGMLNIFVGSHLMSCQVSSAPVIEELVKTKPPTFLNDALHSYTTSTPSFTVTGECDMASAGLEYSFDNINWTTLTGGCVNSGFSISVIASPIKNVYVHALTKFGATPAAQAVVRLALLPSSTAFEFVSAAPIVNNGSTVAIHGALGGSMTGTTSSNATTKLSLGVIGVLYGN